jgi:hypothetical protein
VLKAEIWVSFFTQKIKKTPIRSISVNWLTSRL